MGHSFGYQRAENMDRLAFTILSFLALLPPALTASRLQCESDAIPTPELFGASILSVDAIKVNNYTLTGAPVNFCNVSIVYTHPGEDDTINVWVWLPDIWNSRFQGVGGAGWLTGMIASSMASAIADGYAAVTTDGGHSSTASAGSWGLVSPGNVNLYLLQDFASVALNDMTVLGKQVTANYYGQAIKYSYWNGCSTGGRQGLMMAQRYPEAYDGILAQSPAINWVEFVTTEFWPQQVMYLLNYFPSECELDAITAAAIEACDQLDGLQDGVIGLPGQCHFQANSVVGMAYSCGGTEGQITEAAATIAQSSWTGPRSATGAFQWFGLSYDSSLPSLADTVCYTNGTCVGVPFSISVDWIQIFIHMNPDFNVYNMTQQVWDSTFHASQQLYTSIIGTSDPDLSQFRQAGGKMITWHGMADQLIFFNGTVNYYQRVLQQDPHAADFYRFFMAPGVGHCAGGAGAAPTDPLDALVQWVEEGLAPQTLAANRTVNGTSWQQNLCQYPLASIYVGGDPAKASSFRCE